MAAADIVEDCNRLINNCKTVMLATASENASHSSYAPFIWVDQNVYILVSALAQHTDYLKHADANKIGCMLIQDESESTQIFARRRLMFKSVVVEINRESAKWTELISRFGKRFGDIIELLDSLPDFTIFELRPEDAVLVKGFGDAHQVDESTINNLGNIHNSP